MKLHFIFLLVTANSCFGQNPIFQKIPEKTIYDFVNYFIIDNKIELIINHPSQHYYQYPYSVDSFVEKIKNLEFYLLDTANFNLDENDFSFLKFQINNPSVKKWKKQKIKSCKTGIFTSTLLGYSGVSVPIFSANGETAIIFVTFYGMIRGYIYYWNTTHKIWKQIGNWQNGS